MAHELTEASRAAVFAYLETHPDPPSWDALLAWLARASRDPIAAAGVELVDGTLYALVPGSDIEVLYRVLDSPGPAIDLLRIV